MNLKPLLFLLLLCTGLSACCTKKYCNNDEELEEIYLKNFPPQQTDTVRLWAYLPNTGFMTPIDSLTVYGHPDQGRTVLQLHEFFSVYRDYKLSLSSGGQVFTISGFELSGDKCNTCLLAKKDFYRKLVAYRINGTRYKSKTLEITP